MIIVPLVLQSNADYRRREQYERLLPTDRPGEPGRPLKYRRRANDVNTLVEGVLW